MIPFSLFVVNSSKRKTELWGLFSPPAQAGPLEGGQIIHSHTNNTHTHRTCSPRVGSRDLSEIFFLFGPSSGEVHIHTRTLQFIAQERRGKARVYKMFIPSARISFYYYMGWQRGSLCSGGVEQVLDGLLLCLIERRYTLCP